MLRMYFLQQWFGLANQALQDTIYDSQPMRQFVGIGHAKPCPMPTSLLKFCRLLEAQRLMAQLFESINARLADSGLLRQGTMVDTTLIAALTSTQNKDQARNPEMHQSSKGHNGRFGMKVHIGADAYSGLVHSVHVTAAHESDVAHTHELLHVQESAVYADVGYMGVKNRPEIARAQAQGQIGRDIHWNVARRRSAIARMAQGTVNTLTQALERVKARIRARGVVFVQRFPL